MPPRKKQLAEPVIEPDVQPDVDAEDIPVAPCADGEDTLTFKRSHFYSVLTVLAFAAGILVGYAAWGMDSPAATAAPIANPPAGGVVEAPVTQQAEFTRYDIPTANSYAIGPADAPITIVEFSDYQCPFCRRWHEEVYEPLLAAYPGQIRLVYKHLPLTSIHPEAFSASEAALCAGEQDAFWQFHERLFSSEALGTNTYLQYAEELGLNVKNFETCLTERRYQSVVDEDMNFAIDLGIRSTPTFFINGLAVVGAQPLDIFQQVIDKELRGEIPVN